jgi:hypothetical protein
MPNPIPATTQQHLNIEDITDNLVLLKDGSCCLILETTAINFGLLSEEEQDAIIYSYAGLLNSLTFPLQIIIRSQLKDVSSYLKLLKEQEDKQTRPALKEQTKKYRQFVEKTVKENNVLDKKFYLALLFSLLELGVTQSALSFSKKGLPFPKDYILKHAKTNLYPKRDHVIRQLSKMGLKSQQLTTENLIKLFYNIYNPEAHGQQFAEASQYETPLILANIKGDKEAKMDENVQTPTSTPPVGGPTSTEPPVGESPTPPTGSPPPPTPGVPGPTPTAPPPPPVGGQPEVPPVPGPTPPTDQPTI